MLITTANVFPFQDQFIVTARRENKMNLHYDVMYCAPPCSTGEFHQTAYLGTNGNAISGQIPSIQGHFTNFQGRHIIYSNTKVHF